ncbi:nitroreductase family protein [Burkholderia sp. ABCPW 14]|uniref:nitroreductase family protein n=1 Tax=Burkholderia sp. ABCPW 14 TaxID=1637860 RepID=UPI000A62C938|nr:nitroreductase family protein [Burkholderia sp. ABCPW 14]
MTTFADLLRRHRSIRRYRPDAIPRTLIDDVCADAVAGASSFGNLNSVSLVLTQDPERKRRLYELHGRQPMILQAPLIVTFVADCYRTRRWLARGRARDNFNNLLGHHAALCDAMIVAQNVCLGFEARGLGACYMGSTLTAMRGIAAALALPKTCAPITTLVVGYPDEAPEKRDRLPLDAIVHDEAYRAPTDAHIDASYAERDRLAWARCTSSPANRARVAQLGIDSVAQWYSSELKYDPDRCRRDSDALLEFLVHHDFLRADALRRPQHDAPKNPAEADARERRAPHRAIPISSPLKENRDEIDRHA